MLTLARKIRRGRPLFSGPGPLEAGDEALRRCVAGPWMGTNDRVWRCGEAATGALSLPLSINSTSIEHCSLHFDTIRVCSISHDCFIPCFLIYALVAVVVAHRAYGRLPYRAPPTHTLEREGTERSLRVFLRLFLCFLGRRLRQERGETQA